MPESQAVITGLAAITTAINICFLSQFSAIEFASQHQDLALLSLRSIAGLGLAARRATSAATMVGGDKGGRAAPSIGFTSPLTRRYALGRPAKNEH